MKRLLLAISLLSVVASSCNATSKDIGHAKSVVGVWQMTEDEDGGPLGGVIEFRANSTYVGYAKDCSAYPALPYHIYKGDVFVTNEVPGKGPVSVLFRPSADGTRLTFTSPRTRNNAVYSRSTANRCVPRG